MIVVIVQADLAPCYHLGMPRQLLHRLIGRLIRETRFVRMNPDSGIHERMLFRELNSGVERRGTIAIADCDHCPYSGLASASDHLLTIGVELIASDHLLTIGVELLAIEMCVRIYEHC